MPQNNDRQDKQKEKIAKLEVKKTIAESLLELRDNIGMKAILENSAREVIASDLLLREDGRWERSGSGMKRVPLTERERAELVGKRDALISLIEVFPDAQRVLDAVKAKLERYPQPDSQQTV